MASTRPRLAIPRNEDSIPIKDNLSDFYTTGVRAKRRFVLASAPHPSVANSAADCPEPRPPRLCPLESLSSGSALPQPRQRLISRSMALPKWQIALADRPRAGYKRSGGERPELRTDSARSLTSFNPGNLCGDPGSVSCPSSDCSSPVPAGSPAPQTRTPRGVRRLGVEGMPGCRT